MKLDLNEILKDGMLTARLGLIAVAAVVLVAPGMLLLLITDKQLFISLSISKLFLLSGVASLPRYTLGLLLVVSPYKSMVDLSRQPLKTVTIFVIISAILWGMLSAGVLGLAKVLLGDLIAIYVGQGSLKAYLVLYGSMLMFLVFIASKNLAKFRRMRESENTN